jgi:putative colanic acid biosynthesis acetyltransferase WcaF
MRKQWNGFSLDKQKTPTKFRGKSKLVVQIWWCVQSTLFRLSPQFLYSWRRFLLRLFGAKIGKGVLLRPTVNIVYPWKLEIGDYSQVGDDVVLYTLDQIHIGQHTVISQKCYLCAGTHDHQSENFVLVGGAIKIGNSVWIATDTFVHPGVKIADKVLIAARSTVTKDVEIPAIYAGNPCIRVKDRC